MSNATTPRACKFTVYYSKTGVVRGFDDHDLFADYMCRIALLGAQVTWATSHHAVAVLPPVLIA